MGWNNYMYLTLGKVGKWTKPHTNILFCLSCSKVNSGHIKPVTVLQGLGNTASGPQLDDGQGRRQSSDWSIVGGGTLECATVCRVEVFAVYINRLFNFDVKCLGIQMQTFKFDKKKKNMYVYANIIFHIVVYMVVICITIVLLVHSSTSCSQGCSQGLMFHRFQRWVLVAGYILYTLSRAEAEIEILIERWDNKSPLGSFIWSTAENSRPRPTLRNHYPSACSSKTIPHHHRYQRHSDTVEDVLERKSVNCKMFPSPLPNTPQLLYLASCQIYWMVCC